MKKVLAVAIILLILIPSVPQGRAATGDRWTIMVYMGGGYSQDIADAMPYDLAEIERAGYHSGFNIIVLKDGPEYGDSECLLLGPDGFEKIPLSDLNPGWGNELDMSDWHTLSGFVDWSLREHGAENSMLVMWGHGRGWMGMPNDEGRGVMSISDMSLALQQIREKYGNIDVIGFDQCNMAMMEVFYEIAPYADYAVASEKEEDIAGWPYDLFLSHIYEMENPDGTNVSMQVVKDYVSWARNNSQYSATMSAIDLSEMDAVGGALRNYSYYMSSMLPYYKEEITASRDSTESYDKLPYPYDLVNLTEQVSSRLNFTPLLLSGKALSDAVKSAVMLEMHSTVSSDMSVEGANGMSIWFPSYGSREDYESLAVNRTGWPLFLQKYFSSVPQERGNLHLSVESSDMDSDGANESFLVNATGNGTVYVSIYYGSQVVRSEHGDNALNMSFQWGPGYFSIVAYLLNGTSVENYSMKTGIIEKKLIISGDVVDSNGKEVDARLELSTPHGNFSSEAHGPYEIVLMAPYDFMPGDEARLKACSGGGCTESKIWLNGSAVSQDFTLSSGPAWPAYLAGIAVFLMAAAGYILLFDPTRRGRRKRFKKPLKLKITKKVMWVKDITDRQEELAELKRALEKARNGTGSTIFLPGEEGVGKRTLMEKFRQETGVKSVFYECKGTSSRRPYEPVKKIADMLHSTGMLETSAESVFSGKGKEQISEAFFQAVLSASEKEPLLISVFNAQWLDDESMDLLGYLARGIGDTRCLLVLAAPQEELEDIDGKPHPLNAMLMELIIEGRVRMLRLDRFNREQTRDMLENILGLDVPDEALEKIYEMTRGLPMMIEELGISLRKSGADLHDPSGLEIEIPSTVKDLVSRRLSKLDDKERYVAEWAAVVGNSFSYEDLKELCGEAGLNEVLYALIEDRIITEDGGIYSFDHPEIRNGLLESLGDGAKDMHIKAGEMLERKGAGVYMLAYQFCTGGDKERCLKYSLEAAKEAEKSYAPREAIIHYEKAMELAEDEGLAEIYLALSSNYHILMDYERAIEYAEKVVYSEASPEEKYRAHMLLGTYHLENSRWDDAKENYEKLLDSPDTEMKVEGYRGIGKVYWRTGQHKLAIENISKAVELAESLGDDWLVGSIKVDLANIYSDWGDYVRAEGLYKEAIAMGEKNDSLMELARAYNNLGEVYRYDGKLEEALECYKKCIEYSRKGNLINTLGYGLENTGTAYASLGRLEEAEEYLAEAYKIFSKMDNKYMISGIHMAYGIIYAKQGKWDESEENFRQSAEMLQEIDIKYDLGVTYLEHANALSMKGDYERAREMYERAREIFEEIGSEEHLKKISDKLEGLK